MTHGSRILDGPFLDTMWHYTLDELDDVTIYIPYHAFVAGNSFCRQRGADDWMRHVIASRLTQVARSVTMWNLIYTSDYLLAFRGLL